MSKIVDAVTAVLICDGELLITRRQPFMRSFPGYDSFPGGKVDAEDADGSALPAAWSGIEPRLARALLREIREEVALDLTAAPHLVSSVRAIGIALTPPPAPMRFNTHFYVVELTERPELKADPSEVDTVAWGSPAEWVNRYSRGELLIAPPTIAVLHELARNPQTTDVPGLHFEARTQYELPVIESTIGVRQILVRSHTLPPAHHTNCYLLGDSQSHRVLVDPSPSSDEEMDKLICVVERFGIHEIFLTHHHPDHHERSNRIARHFGVPMGMSEDTHHRICLKKGNDYFDNIPVHHYQEGDVLCRWLGLPLQVLEVPGHDQGQLALMPADRAWCLVGDLIQGLGTVVIAKPEGHMGRYFASLQKIIALDPRAIYPSHGMGLGGCYRLSETLLHRQQREQQVLTMHREGQDIAQMLARIYSDVDPRLLPLAQMNIESHMDKLREEGLIAA
ncbi:MAG: MBL fold metallo-hydrolase [Pseudomonadota bacterium]|nr:MBL fold metallo-hydrolase [Pseudomonadota bacterium]